MKQTNNTQLSSHLNTQGAKPNMATPFKQALNDWYLKNNKQLISMLGSKAEARRLGAGMLNAIQQTPSLLECTQQSLFSCMLKSAELNLFPGAIQECAYVPFRNSKKNCKEATFVVQFQGLVQLLYRSGQVKDIEAEVVCENDYFEFTRGSDRKLIFQPTDGDLSQRGAWLGVYCVIRNAFGGLHIEYLTAAQIDSIKRRSPAAQSSDSPWNSKHVSDVAWMWRKSALKQCAKLAPRSARTISLSLALAADEKEPSEDDSNFDRMMSDIGKGLPEPKQGVDFSSTNQTANAGTITEEEAEFNRYMDEEAAKGKA